MEKDLFGVDINNLTDEVSLLTSQLINFDFYQFVKSQYQINGRKLINFFPKCL